MRCSAFLGFLFSRLVFTPSLRCVIEIPIRSQFSSSLPCLFSLGQSSFSLFLSVLGRLFLRLRLRLRLSFPSQDTHSSIIPGLLEKGSISLVYVRADVQFALSYHELQCTSVTKIFSWPFQTRMCGNCAFGRSLDFKYRLQAYPIFGYLNSKKLTAFLPKTVCLSY